MRTIKSKVLSLLAVLCSGMAFAAQIDNGVKTVFVPAGGSTKVVSLSSEAGAWTATSANTSIATITPATFTSRDVVTNTITAAGVAGTCTTCTVSNASAKWTYNVRIDNHTNVKRGTANFVREMTTIVMDKPFPAVTGGANWISWSDDPEMATVVLQDLDKPDDDPAAELNGAVNVLAIVKQTCQKAGKTTVYVENDKNNDLYAIDVTVQTISDVSVPLRHCEEESDTRGFYTVTEILPDAGATTDNPDSWGYDYAYSTDESIAKIRIVDGEDGKKHFEIYNPVGDDGRDGNARVFFIKNTTDVMENDAKIWIFDVSASTVEVDKYLTFKADKKAAETNATLNIRTHFLHNVKEVYTNKVLFVGTGCDSHSLKRSTIVESIQAIQEKADVDVYLYRGDGANSGFKGTFTKGGTNKFEDPDIGLTLDGNMHGCLTKFYNLFYDIATNEVTRYKYDYIVMEFDGQRLGSHDNTDNYQPNEDRDKVVAEWLNEYYEGSKDSETARVIWIVDDQAVSSGTYPITIHYQESNRVEGVDYFFRPYQANISGSGSDSQDNEEHGLNDVRFRGLIGLLNPWTYLNHDLYRYSGTALTAILDEVCPKVHYIIGNNVDKFVHTGEKYIHQAYYNNKDNLVDYLKNHIVDTTYAAQITDNVETQGLQFVEGTLKMFGSYDKAAVTGGDPISNSNWQVMWQGDSAQATTLDPTGSVVAVNHSITGQLDNIVREYWNLIQVDLVDADGSFRAGAKYDETLGKYVRDPNLNTNELDRTQGEAAVAYFYDTMWPLRGVWDEDETLWDWAFEPRSLHISAESVVTIYNGTPTNIINVVVSNDLNEVLTDQCTIEFRGNYDDPVTGWKPAAEFPGYTDCTSTPVWIAASLTGYDSVTNEGTWSVTITQRWITVSAIDTNKVYGADEPKFSYKYDLSSADEINEGDFVKGLLDKSAEGKTMFGREEGEDANDDPGYAITNEIPFVANGNYKIAYKPAKMTIAKDQLTVDEPPEEDRPEGWATPFDYIGIYDAKGHTISFKINPAVAAKDPTKKTQVRFSKDDGSTWTGWTDYIDDFDAVYANGLMFTNCCDAVKVCVEAKNEPNYFSTNLFGYVTITQRVVTVTADDKSKIYGYEDPDLTARWYDGLDSADEIGEYEIVSNALAECAAATATDMGLGREEGEDAGTYDITNAIPYEVVIDGVSNYRVEFVKGTFTISGGDLTFIEGSVGGYTNKYDAAEHGITFAVDPADDGDSHATLVRFSTNNKSSWTDWADYKSDVTQIEGYPKFKDCGEYPVWVQASNAWVTAGFIETNATVLITQRVITVTAQFAEKDYNAPEPAFAWELGGDYVPSEKDWIINEKFGGTGSGLVRPGAGTQERAGGYTDAITSNKVFNAGGNYIVEFYKGNFRINPKQLVLTATPADHAYDGTGYTIGLSINYDKDEKTGASMWVSVRKGEGEWSDWVEWENLETVLPKITNVVDSTTISAKAVCNRPVTTPKPLLTASASNNYTASDTASATVTITPIPATVRAGDLTKLKGQPDPDPYSATVTTTGLIPADEGQVTFTYSMRINKHKENVGKYKNVVEPFGAVNQGNYTVTYVAGMLIIESNGDPCEGLTGVCACGEVDKAGCLVYDVVIKVKTLKPQKKSGCGEIGDVYYLSDTTRTIKGYMWFCGDGCWSTDDAVRLTLWDKKAKSAIVPLYYAVEDGVMVQYPYTFNFDFLGRYTKKANKIAANWTLDEGVFTLGCAAVNGSSTLDKEEGTIRLKSISGNCAGMLSLGDVTVKGHCGEESTFTAKIAELCDCWDNWCDDGDDADEVPATGTWKITYNKKLSKSSKSMLETVPSYAREPKPAEPAK